MEDDLFEPVTAPEVFVDGFTEYVTHDGVMTCVGYRQTHEGKVVVLKLVWPVVNTNAAIAGANAAMAAQTQPTPKTKLKAGVH